MSTVAEAAEKGEHYLRSNNNYLVYADTLLKIKDYVQASERLWGAAAEIVKEIAAKRGIARNSHLELYLFVAKLKPELHEPELLNLFSLAGALHQNFYEDWLPPEAVMDYAEAMKKLVSKLMKTI